MKDRVIDEKLTRYAESVKPKTGILDGAVFALRQRRQDAQSATESPRSAGVPRSRRSRAGLISALAAVIVAAAIIGIAIGIINGGFGGDKQGPTDPAVITPYALSSLNVSAGSLADAQSAGILTLAAETDETQATQGKVYKNDKGEIAVISIFYKTFGEGGVDEILVIADIGRGLTDYKEFKALQGVAIAGVTVYQREEMRNGEYYTNLYFVYKDIDYYLIIASPLADGAELYVRGLVER
jgi:hypothetical protein